MRTAFDIAVDQTLKHEGVFSNDLYDPGGETKYGISKRAYPHLNIRNLTIEQAVDIYYRDYWLKMRSNEIKDIKIAAEIFDTAVNMGRVAAVFIIQRALNYLGENVVEDGILGPTTLKTLNKWAEKDSRALFVALNGFQFIRYVEIKNKAFSRGWTKRIQDYRS